MFRVREQLGCSDDLVRSCGRMGTTVAVLDTGVCYHPDFDNRLLLFHDFVNHRKDFYDDSGHGTHVCGIIAGSGKCSMGKYKGIDPYAKLIVAKVLDQKGDGFVEYMIEAIKWIFSLKEIYHIRILNISIGMGEHVNEKRMAPLLELIDEAWKRGLIVICAAGNNGPLENTISPIATRNCVITVGCNEGGYLGSRDDLCEHYSSRGKQKGYLIKPEIVAPGTEIVSCNAFYEKRRFVYKNAYVKKSGTSMSAPIVSGAVSLLIQKHPELTNNEVKTRLMNSVVDLNKPKNLQGAGMLHIKSLLT